MTELEKCMAGEWYDCHDKVFLEFKNKTHRLLMKYNSLPYDHKEEKRQVLKEMLGSVGTKVSIGHRQYGLHVRGLQQDHHRQQCADRPQRTDLHRYTPH